MEGHAVAQGYGGPFVSEVVRVVVGKPEAFQCPVPGLTEKVGVDHASGLIPNGQPFGKRFQGGGRRYIAPFTLFPMLQGSVEGNVLT
ncbi:hypothetical protein HOK021_26510 [Streptomyces hygroscopicus]|nr:hypothetical protein HOK021_26510 [Streptomyces hygroscopicus]